MIKDLFKESSDERIELLTNKVASRGFYILVAALLINNIVKSFVLELDKSYWVDSHYILLGVAVVVIFMEIRTGLGLVGISSYPKSDRKRIEKIYMLSFMTGVFYFNIMTSGFKLSDGPIGIIAILITTFIYAIVAYGIYKLVVKIRNRKR